MNCEPAREKLHDFLEDSLPEDERARIREHLEGCQACAQFALQVGTFSSDLRHFVSLEIPFDLGEEIVREIQIQKTEEKVRGVRFRHKAWKLTAGTGITLGVLLGILLPSIHYFNQYQASKVNAQSQRQGQVVLKELEEIDARLARFGGAHSKEKVGKGESLRASNTPPSVASEIKLRPFHWHLSFQSVQDQEKFTNALEGLDFEIRFDGGEFLVLSVDRGALQKLAEVISANKGTLPKEVPARLSRLPKSEGRVTVSLVLNPPQDNAMPFEHWHLNFRLSNRFSFLERLKEVKDSFLFEAPEFWVLELTPSELAEIKIEAQDFLGLEIIPQSPEIAPNPSGTGTIRLGIYVAEG